MICLLVEVRVVTHELVTLFAPRSIHHFIDPSGRPDESLAEDTKERLDLNRAPSRLSFMLVCMEVRPMPGLALLIDLLLRGDCGATCVCLK